MKKLLWIPLVAGVLLVSGCGSNPPIAEKAAPTNGEQSLANRTPGSVQLPSEPKEVVRLFLDSMRQGNGAQLSALLSVAAREEITRKKLEIAPVGSPMATFKIGDAAEQTDGMLVSTIWSEPEQNGQPAADLEVVWELRKEPAGWRICGMAVDPMTGDVVQVVNFEHLELDQPAPKEQRMASLPNTPGSLPTNGYPPAANAMPQPSQQGGFPPPAMNAPYYGQLPSAQSNNYSLPSATGNLPAPNGIQPPAYGNPPLANGNLPPAYGNLPPAGSPDPLSAPPAYGLPR